MINCGFIEKPALGLRAFNNGINGIYGIDIKPTIPAVNVFNGMVRIV